MVLQANEAKGLAPPLPGNLTLGASWSPITVEFKLPYASICAPPNQTQHYLRSD